MRVAGCAGWARRRPGQHEQAEARRFIQTSSSRAVGRQARRWTTRSRPRFDADTAADAVRHLVADAADRSGSRVSPMQRPLQACQSGHPRPERPRARARRGRPGRRGSGPRPAEDHLLHAIIELHRQPDQPVVCQQGDVAQRVIEAAHPAHHDDDDRERSLVSVHVQWPAQDRSHPCRAGYWITGTPFCCQPVQRSCCCDRIQIPDDKIRREAESACVACAAIGADDEIAVLQQGASRLQIGQVAIGEDRCSRARVHY